MRARHEYFMEQALNLALKARGQTSPNPLVGALVVKGDRIISGGYHKMAGSAHAEVEALRVAGRRAYGASLYVTLEPCCVFGRTPACTELIKNACIKRVYVGMRDPNPKNNGKGIKILRDCGIEVEVGFLEERLKRINEFYLKYITRNIPFVCVKVGQSLDGKIATKTGDSQWITSSSARTYARGLRPDFDAIMVGINTVIADNPGLEPKLKKKHFFKIIVDSHLRIPLYARILKVRPQFVIIATGPKTPRLKAKRLENLGVKILSLPIKNGNLNLEYLLKESAKFEVTSILVEGGGNLIGSLFDGHLVDKALFFIAPNIIGGKTAISSVMGEGVERIEDVVNLKNLTVKRIGEDYLFEGDVK